MYNTLGVTERHDLELIVSDQIKSLINEVCHKITTLIEVYVQKDLIWEIRHLHYMEQLVISANKLVDHFYYVESAPILEQIHLIDKCNIWLSAFPSLDMESGSGGSESTISFLRTWIEGANINLYPILLYIMSPNMSIDK